MTAVSVFGLGKLGAPLAAVLAASGHTVTGFDPSTAMRDKLRAGKAPVVEPGLQELITENTERLIVANQAADAVAASEVTFVVVPTPSGADGGFICDYVLDACEAIGSALASSEERHLVVICSTVMPEAMNRHIAPALSKAAGVEIGGRLKLCYNPEFIALGSVIHDMRNPDMVLIGESDPDAGAILLDVLSPCWESSPQVHRMAFSNAELAKIAVNAFVTMKISFANVLGELCEGLVEGDVDAVSNAIGADSRIGRKYLKSGMGYGGPCFPRDNRAFELVSQMITGNQTLASRVDEINDRQPERNTRAVLNNTKDGDTVLILGASYKPGTIVMEASQSLTVAKLLQESGRNVILFDDQIRDGARARLAEPFMDLRFEQDIATALEQAHAIVLSLPDPALAARCTSLIRSRTTPVRVFDIWRMMPELANLKHVAYYGSGLGFLDGAG